MRYLFVLLLTAGVASAAPTLVGSKGPIPTVVDGLKNPESVCVGPDGRVYVTVIGEFDKDGDGAVVVVDERQGRRRSPPASTTPRASSPSGKWLFVADKTRVLRIDAQGQGRRSSPTPKAFPVAADLPQRHRRSTPRAARSTSATPADGKGGGGADLPTSTRRARQATARSASPTTRRCPA